MGRAGRYNVRARRSSRLHGSPLQSTKPSSSVQPAAGGSRATACDDVRRPEGGPGRARMKKRVFTILLAAGLLAVAAFTVLTFPAAAQTQTVYVQLASGEVVPVQVDVPPGSTLDDIQLPGTPVPAPSTPEPTTPTTPSVPKPPPTTTTPAPSPGGDGGSSGPTSEGGSPQERTSSGKRVRDNSVQEIGGGVKARAKDEA